MDETIEDKIRGYGELKGDRPDPSVFPSPDCTARNHFLRTAESLNSIESISIMQHSNQPENRNGFSEDFPLRRGSSKTPNRRPGQAGASDAWIEVPES